eukprot:1396056-Amphidinium_carterae.1
MAREVLPSLILLRLAVTELRAPVSPMVTAADDSAAHAAVSDTKSVTSLGEYACFHPRVYVPLHGTVALEVGLSTFAFGACAGSSHHGKRSLVILPLLGIRSSFTSHLPTQ